jgi:hypothetical protein
LLPIALVPRFTAEGPRLSYSLRRVDYGAIDTKDYGIKAYEVSFGFRWRPRNSAIRFKVTADRPLTAAQATMTLSTAGDLREWWGAEPEQIMGNSAIFSFSVPSLERRHIIHTRVESARPVRILSVRSRLSTAGARPALDLMPRGSKAFGNPPAH